MFNNHSQTVIQKKWTYDDLTELLEELIKKQVLDASKGTDIDKIVCMNMARGIYLSWHRLTRGVQRDGDSDRLEALIELKNG